MKIELTWIRAASDRLRNHRPSPAMAVALLALLVAMSGTAIATTQLSKNSVGSGNIKPGAVAYSDLRNGAIRDSKLGREGVTAEALRDGGVVGAKLGEEAVSSGKLALGAVLAGNLGKESVLNDKLADGAVDGNSVADGALGTEDFSSGIPAARVTATQDQDVLHEQNVNLAFDSEMFDTANMHTNSGIDNTKLVAPVDGVYWVSGYVEWSGKSNAQGSRLIAISKNDSGPVVRDVRPNDTFEANVEVLDQSVSTVVVLKAGDYVKLRIYQDTTQYPAETNPTISSLAIPGNNSPELSMVWIAPGPG
jgi:hypothetical protein